MEYKKISIVIPAYNEEKTLSRVVESVISSDVDGLEKEIILIDDCSTDATAKIITTFSQKENIRAFRHKKNSGKGAALRTGFSKATGDILLIQDADLEYDPKEYRRLIEPILSGSAMVVYGSRMANKNPVGYWYMYLGNYFISLFAKILYGRKITDIETCYKVFTREVLEGLLFTSNDFGFEAEFSAYVLKKGFPITEIPISYSPRKYTEGKKISWKDGVKALWILWRNRWR